MSFEVLTPNNICSLIGQEDILQPVELSKIDYFKGIPFYEIWGEYRYIYFLRSNLEIVYVGQSNTPFSRVEFHRTYAPIHLPHDCLKKFDSISFLKIVVDDDFFWKEDQGYNFKQFVNRIEMCFIGKFQPQYNITGNPKNKHLYSASQKAYYK